MSSSSPERDEKVLAEIDSICDRFESLWKAGQTTNIDSFLTLQGDGQNILFEELLQLEWYYRRQRGEKFDAADYLSRFPDKALIIERVRDANMVYWPTIEGYEIEAQLGQGGMGAVFQARDLKLHRKVGLKVIHPHLLSAEMRDHFQQEARAVARLDHPNIVKIFEVGEWFATADQSPVPYLTLELIKGGSLASHLEMRLLHQEEAIRLVRILAKALAHAHSRGVIHRDLKPENILFAEAADEPNLNVSLGCPKINDFGVASHFSMDPLLSSERHLLVGTPAYMAPEQADGSHEAGAPADVHGLGVILYLLLTGKLPYRAENKAELLRKIRLEAPARYLHENQNIPAKIKEICLSCLEKEPGKRPTALQLAAKLEEYLQKGKDGSPHDPSRWMTRRNSMAAALSTLGLGGFVWWARAMWPMKKVQGHLAGDLVVRVWSTDNKNKRGLRIGWDSGAVPVREGEQIQIETHLGEPAYAFLFWIDGKGAITPLFPWNEGSIQVKQMVGISGKLTRGFVSPPELHKGWPLDDTDGLETILLLARIDPLPRNWNWALALGNPPTIRYRDRRDTLVRGWEHGVPVPPDVLGITRGPKDKTELVEDPLLPLIDRVKNDFDLIRMVQFAHEGKAG